MLGHLSIRRYSLGTLPSSDNPIGAGNQQERPERTEVSFRNPQRLYAEHPLPADEEIVRAAWRHAEAGRNVQPLINLQFEISNFQFAILGSNKTERSSLSGKFRPA